LNDPKDEQKNSSQHNGGKITYLVTKTPTPIAKNFARNIHARV